MGSAPKVEAHHIDAEYTYSSVQYVAQFDQLMGCHRHGFKFSVSEIEQIPDPAKYSLT